MPTDCPSSRGGFGGFTHPRSKAVSVMYFSTEPIVTDKEIKAMKTKEEQEAAHQKNRRTDFTVLSFDYVPKEGGTPSPNQ